MNTTHRSKCARLARRTSAKLRHLHRPRIEVLEERRLLTTVNWISPTSGDWDVGSNWSNGQVPGTGDDVVINVPGASPTITIDSGAQSVNSVTAADPLVISGGSLTLAAASEIDGPLSVSGSTTLSIDSGLTLTGQTTWSAGAVAVSSGATLTNTGTLTINSVTTPSNGVNPDLTGTLTNTGTITFQGSGNFDGGTIDNQSSGLIDIEGVNSDAYPLVFATIDNSGTIDSASTGVAGIWILNNTGGAIDVETGTLFPWVQEGSVSTGGTFTVASGATLQYNSGNEGSTFTGTYTGSGAGQFVLSSGQLNVGAGGATFDFAARFFQWQLGGYISATAGTLTNTGSITVTSGPTGNATLYGTLDNTGTITLEGSGNFVGERSTTNSGGSLTSRASTVPSTRSSTRRSTTRARSSSASTGTAGIWILNNTSGCARRRDRHADARGFKKAA